MTQSSKALASRVVHSVRRNTEVVRYIIVELLDHHSDRHPAAQVRQDAKALVRTWSEAVSVGVVGEGTNKKTNL